MADTRTTVPFEELRADQVELVGGKCANLGELTGAGFPVPPGFAVTTAAYERDDIGAAVGEAYAELGRQVGQSDPPVAVRSSAIAEDMPDASFAGVQDTYLWICGWRPCSMASVAAGRASTTRRRWPIAKRTGSRAPA